MTGPRILFLDHEDSFAGNLVAALRARGAHVEVAALVRGQKELPFEASVGALSLSYDGLVLGPGPGHPREHPATLALCRTLLAAHATALPMLPLLGICLGLQTAGWAVGANVASLPSGLAPVHGRRVHLTGPLELGPDFGSVRAQGHVTLHNSLAVPLDDEPFGRAFRTLVGAEDGVLLAVGHHVPWLLCQFHPESFGSTAGDAFLDAFARKCGSPMRPPL